MTDIFMIADGHDNTPGLQPLHLLNPPMFAKYNFGVLTEWYGAESVEPDGDDEEQPIGQPHIDVFLTGMTAAEYAWLRASLSRYVTLLTYDKDANAWGVYNAEWKRLRTEVSERARTWHPGYGWRETTLYFDKLDFLFLASELPTFYTFDDGSFVTFDDGSYAVVGA